MQIKGKRNIKYFIAFITLITIIFTTNIVKAENIKSEECTNQYKRWSVLSEKERAEYIEPTIHPIKFDPSYLENTNNSVAPVVKGTLPDKYDVRDKLDIEVRNQGTTAQCWAFSMMTVLESNIALRTKKVSEKFSERHLDYATSRTFLDGTNNIGFSRELGGGGNFYTALAYATNGTGVVRESDMPFEDNENKINLEAINKAPVLKINDAKVFTTLIKHRDANTSNVIVTDGSTVTYTDEQVEAVRNHIKQYIMENGPLSAFTYSNGKQYYNNEDIFKASAYYCDKENVTADHAVTIVGWDDNYAVENFNPDCRPNNPGAYLVLNSYGNQVMDNGFYYISYEDALIESSVVGISDSENINYDNIYQHDFYGYNNDYSINGLNELYAANVFTRKTNKIEELEEVVICTPVKTNIEVYVNPENDSLDRKNLQKVDIETSTIDETYNTVRLKTPIELKGDKFVIAVKYTVDKGSAAVGVELNYKTAINYSSMYDYVTSSLGEGFISIDLRLGWEDLAEVSKDTSICIKGLTTIKNNSSNISDNNGDSETEPPIKNIEYNKPDTNKDTGSTTKQPITINKTGTDGTTSTKILPNAGKMTFITIIVIIVVITLISGYKTRKFKDIK